MNYDEETEVEIRANKHAALRGRALSEKKEWPQDCITHEAFNGYCIGFETAEAKYQDAMEEAAYLISVMLPEPTCKARAQLEARKRAWLLQHGSENDDDG